MTGNQGKKPWRLNKIVDQASEMQYLNMPRFHYCGECNIQMNVINKDTFKCNSCAITESRITLKCPLCNKQAIETVEVVV